MVLAVGSRVAAKGLDEWGIGVITASEDGRFFTSWPAKDGEREPYTTDLWAEQLVAIDTESPETIGEEVMERLYEVEQSVHDAGGNLGLISSYEERDNGIFYRVLWEDGKETLNIQSVLQPVHETKAPTPKEVREVVEAKAPQYDVLDVIESWGLNFSLSSVIKLVHAGELEDLKQAASYLKRRIDKLEAK